MSFIVWFSIAVIIMYLNYIVISCWISINNFEKYYNTLENFTSTINNRLDAQENVQRRIARNLTPEIDVAYMLEEMRKMNERNRIMEIRIEALKEMGKRQELIYSAGDLRLLNEIHFCIATPGEPLFNVDE